MIERIPLSESHQSHHFHHLNNNAIVISGGENFYLFSKSIEEAPSVSVSHSYFLQPTNVFFSFLLSSLPSSSHQNSKPPLLALAIQHMFSFSSSPPPPPPPPPSSFVDERSLSQTLDIGLFKKNKNIIKPQPTNRTLLPFHWKCTLLG
jgi:hypothetical protein